MSPHGSILYLPTLPPQITERLTVSVEPYTLRLCRPVKTSRGEYETKRICYLRLQNLEQADHVGYGECAPVPQLSYDDLSNYQAVLEQPAGQIVRAPGRFGVASLHPYSSTTSGLATATNSLVAAGHSSEEGSKKPFRDTPLTRDELDISINGLIWMGDKVHMYEQIKAKLV